MTAPAYVEALRQAIASPNDDGTVTIGVEDAVDLLASAPSSPVIDPDYASRPGYDRAFLGGSPLAMPVLKGAAAKDTVTFTGPNGKTDELRYHHFSVVMSKSRRFARLTAVNIDGTQPVRPPRESDKWILYEALVNPAFRQQPVKIICGLDARDQPDSVTASLWETHPLTLDGDWSDNDHFDDPRTVVRARTPVPRERR